MKFCAICELKDKAVTDKRNFKRQVRVGNFVFVSLPSAENKSMKHLVLLNGLCVFVIGLLCLFRCNYFISMMVISYNIKNIWAVARHD